MKRCHQSAVALIIAAACAIAAGCFHWPETDEISIDEATQVLETQSAGMELLDSLSQQQDSGAVGMTVNWLQSQAPVQDAVVTDSGNISVIYECGITASILTSVPPTDPIFSHDASINGKVPVSETLGLSALASSEERKRAIFLLPFEHQYGVPSSVYRLIQELQSQGYEVSGPLLNSEVTVSTYESLGDYDFIYIFTHGNAHEISFLNQIAISTGSKANPKSIVDTIRRLAVGIEIMSIPDEGHFFAVNGRLLDNTSYSDSVVVVNACESFKYRALANAFLNQGSSVFFGWTDLTWYDFIDVSTALLAQFVGRPNFTARDAYVTQGKLDVGAYHGEFSIDEIFPVTRRYKEKVYSPDLRMDGDGDHLLSSLVYAESNSVLYAVHPASYGQDLRIGGMVTATGAMPDITDVAWDGLTRTLYAISFRQLYLVDPLTAMLYPIGGGLGWSDVNALAAADGSLYAMNSNGELLRVNKTTGTASSAGNLGASVNGSGDLAFSPKGLLYGTVRVSGSTNDKLVMIDKSDGSCQQIGSIGYDAVFGLFFAGEELYGVTADNELIAINTSTGAGTFVRDLTFSAWGAQNLEN